MACLLTGLTGGMTSLAGCVACQACTCVGSSLCTYCCGKMCGSTPTSELVASRSARLSYFGLTLVSVIIAWVFRDFAPESITGTDFFSNNLKCPPEITDPSCMSRAFVLRMVFATMLFHFMLMAATIGANDFSNPRIIVHTGVWPIKIAVWLLLHLVPFCMPSSFFIGYGWVAFAAGILFLLVQTIIFIEYIFDTNESLIAKDGTDNIKGPWHMLILAASVLMFAGSIAMSVIGFTWFDEVTDGSSTGCGLYTFFNVWNVLLWIGLTLLSFRATEWMPATGLMPSMLVACFMTFKMLSALFAQTQCNDLAAAGADTLYKGPPELIPAVTIIIAVVMQGYASCTISQSMDMDGMFWGPSKNSGGALGPGALGPDGQIHDRQVPLVTMDKITVEPIAENKMEHEEVGVQLQGPIGYNVAAFHLAFWLGICYVGMQLTNWNEDFSKASVDKGVTSMWIKIVDSWVLAVAYLWAMIAPKVLRGRSFS